MKIIRYNISKPRKYKGKDGVEKTQWNNIGTITEFHKEDGKISKLLEIPAINLEASVFLIEDKQKLKYDEGEVAPDDIPF